jgi:ribosomal 50S subunit-recycling heat shock protein
VRLDLFLKKTHLVRQRTAAKAICDAGAALVNGSVAKASQEVRPGDRVQLRLAHRDVEVRVLEIPHGNVSKNAARNCIETLRDAARDPHEPI